MRGLGPKTFAGPPPPVKIFCKFFCSSLYRRLVRLKCLLCAFLLGILCQLFMSNVVLKFLHSKLLYKNQTKLKQTTQHNMQKMIFPFYERCGAPFCYEKRGAWGHGPPGPPLKPPLLSNSFRHIYIEIIIYFYLLLPYSLLSSSTFDFCASING